MASAPLISVMMPVHNAGQNLSLAVNSICQQSLTDFELIIVDDHSTDNALQPFNLTDPRIKLQPNEGKGIVAALNTAAKIAQGQFLARMDADDIALPQRLAQQIKLFEKYPQLGITGTKVKIFAEYPINLGYRLYQQWINHLDSPALIQRDIFIECPIPHPTAMFRRAVFQQLGGYLNTPWAEDYDIFLRAHQHNVQMAKPNDILLHWRDSPQRLSKTHNNYNANAFLQAKAHYLATFLPPQPVMIWGAGNLGKKLFDALSKQGINITGFIDVNRKIIGNQRRQRPIYAIDILTQPQLPFIIGCVGSRGARKKMRLALIKADKQEIKDFIFVA